MKRALLQLHMAVLLAGVTGVLGRSISLKEGPLVWYRMGITTLALLVLLALTGRLKRLHWREMGKMALVGFFLAIHWLFFYGSIKYANVSIALVCFSAGSFFAAFLDPLFLKKRFNAIELLLSLIAMLGIYVIMHFDAIFLTGIVLGLLAAFFSALFTVLSKKLTERHDAYTMSFYEVGAGFLCLTIVFPFYLRAFPQTNMVPSAMDWVYLLILSLVCTVWAFILAFSSLEKVSSFTTNLTYNLEPVYGILLAFVVFREDRYLGPHFYWGLLLIVLSVALQSLRMLRVRERWQRRYPNGFRLPWG